MIDDLLRAPRNLQVVFLSIMLLLAATLGWLGWRLLVQDRQLSVQRLADQRETAADLAAAALEKRLSGIEQDLDRALTATGNPKKPPASHGALFVQFQAGAIRVWPENGLLYYPELPATPEAPAALFAAADELEFKKRDYSNAIAALRILAASSDLKVRAAALMRTARNLVKGGQPEESLKIYAQLAALGPATVGQMPAALAARAGTLAIFDQQKDPASRLTAARDLYRELNSGHLPVSFATYESLAEEARRWLPDAERRADPRTALAQAVQWLWESREKGQGGRRSLTTAAGPVLLLWRGSATGHAAFAAGEAYLNTQWLADIQPMLDARQVRLALTNPDARDMTGNPGGRPAVRHASITQLPWTLQVFNTNDDEGELRSRRNLLAAGMAVLLMLILTGGWFIGHTVARDLAVVRLRSDFVSAVSHEFRTPLTTLCQLSELLVRGRVATDDDRHQYYELLHSESHRLRRLVEALLNFGRLEAGKMQLHFEEVDAAALVRQSASEFAEGQQGRGHRFELVACAGSSMVHADRETLRCVFWNLFENAVKYSPDCDTVWVELGREGKQVEIAVRDGGVGIPAGEQQRVFDNFVRGSAARASGVRGTGIGLALARQIVRAHGGEITLESEPGKGSTFRVLLPSRET